MSLKRWFDLTFPLTAAGYREWRFHRSYLRAVKSIAFLNDHLIEEGEYDLVRETLSILTRMPTERRGTVSYGGIDRASSPMWRNRQYKNDWMTDE